MLRTLLLVIAAISVALAAPGPGMAQETLERDGTTFARRPWGTQRPRPALTEQEQKQGWVTFVPGKLDGIGPTAYPTRDEIQAPLAAFACPGEYEPATFAIYAVRELQSVTVQPSKLISATKGVIPPLATDIRAVRVWPQRTSWNSREFYVIPELLEKRYEVDVPASAVQQYWVTFAVPRDARPGTYEGYIRVSAGDQARIVPIKLRVLPFRLVHPRGMVWGLWPDTARWRTYTDQQILAELTDWKAHGINGALMYPLTHGKFSLQEGELQADLSEFERFMDLYEIAQVGSPVVASLQGIAGLVHRLLGQQPDDYGPQFSNLMLQITRRIEDLRKVKQWPEFIYHTVDEPGGHAAVQAEALETLKILHEAGFRTFTTADDRFAHDVLDPFLDVRCYGIGFCARSAQQAAQVKAHCEASSDVYCWYGTGCYTGQEGSMAVNRHYGGFLLDKTGASGAWAWTFQRAKGDPYNDFDGAGSREQKDACITYPPRAKGGPPVPTLQWEGIREGVDDISYLTVLRMALSDLHKQDTPQARSAHGRLQRELRALLDGVPWVGQGTFSNTSAQLARWKIADMVIQAATVLGKEPPRIDPQPRPGKPNVSPIVSATVVDVSDAVEQAPIPVGHLPRMATTPAIDGNLGDEWDGAFTIDDLVAQDGTPNLHRTQVSVGRSADTLYVAFRCYEDQMDRIRASVGDHDGDVWTDDSVELFLDAAGDQRTYAHLMVNSLGTKRDSWHARAGSDPQAQAAEDISQTEDLDWGLGWQAASGAFDQGWCAEIAVPIRSLRAGPSSVWNVNFHRTRRVEGGREYGCWSPTFSGFHVPGRFGKLLLGGGAVNVTALAMEPARWGDNTTILTVDNSAGLADVEVAVHIAGTAVQSQSVLLYPGLNEIEASYDLERGGPAKVEFELRPTTVWRDVSTVPLQQTPRKASRSRPSASLGRQVRPVSTVPTRLSALAWLRQAVAPQTEPVVLLAGQPGFDIPVRLNLGRRLARRAHLAVTVAGPAGILSQTTIPKLDGNLAYINVGTLRLPAGTYYLDLAVRGSSDNTHTARVPFTITPGPWD